MLWLAKKDETDEGGVWIRLANRRVAQKDRLSFIAGVRSDGPGSEGKGAESVSMKANLVLPDGSKRPVKLVRGAEGFTRLAPRPGRTGRLRRRGGSEQGRRPPRHGTIAFLGG